jgi:phosphate-selective porin OprO/OprP
MKSSPFTFFVVALLATSAHAQPSPDPAPEPATAGKQDTQPTEPAPPTPAPPPEPAPPPPPTPAPAPVAAPVLDVAAFQALVDERIAAQPRTAGYQAGDGFFLRASDDSAKLHIGGYTQFDGRFFYNETTPSQIDQFGFRSIRPEFLGTVFDHYDFRLLPDFAGGKVVVQEAYVDLHYVDEVEVRFGKAKVPFGLERLQPEIATTFTERGLPSLLTPNRDLGVQVFGNVGKGLLQYQLGIVNGVADNASTDVDTSDKKVYVARVFVTPVPGGPGFGGGATYGYEHGTTTQTDLGTWTTQAGTTFFQYKTGTTSMDTPLAEGLHWRATAHASWYTGPLGLLAEYVHSQQHVEMANTRGITGADAWQVLGQFVVVGGTSTYRGVVPVKWDPKNGQFGAFDVAARVGEIKLSDSTPFALGFADPTKSASKAFSAGGGVDWLPNRSFRFVLDLERTWFTRGATMGDRPAETSLIGRVQTVF